MKQLALFSFVALAFAACSEAPVAPNQARSAVPLFSIGLADGVPLTIVGFDHSRGLNFSVPDGSYFTAGRNAVLGVNANTTFSRVNQLSSAGLGGADIVVLSSSRDNVNVIIPLSSTEQDVLLNFILGGGCAVLFAENHTLAGTPQTDIANESILDPFGLDVDGTIGGPFDVAVPNPTLSPVTDGPFGVVSLLALSHPGGFTNLGSYATGLASFSLGVALAVIEPGALASGSGPVVLLSDATGFADLSFNSAGRFPENEVLWLNAIDYCLTPACSDERLASIKADVEDLATAGTFNLGQSGSLTMKLSLAQKKMCQGNGTAAINMLGAFINEVEGMMGGNNPVLTPAQGQPLIDGVQAAIDALET